MAADYDRLFRKVVATFLASSYCVALISMTGGLKKPLGVSVVEDLPY
jgi:hypothetical protein